MGFFIETAAGAVVAIGKAALFFGALGAVELLLPRERRASLAQHLQALVFWCISIPVTTLAFASFQRLWLAVGIGPLFTLRLGDWLGASLASAMVAAVIAGIIADFWFYWMHRVQHAWCWRFHAVHHSITNLSAINSYHHVTDELFRIVLLVIPSSLILRVQAPAVPLLFALIIAGHGLWVHSSTRLNLAPLRWLLVDNEFHRIHHSTNPAHFDKNYGAFTTLWDRLFGTAYFPKRGEWPDTGLMHHAESNGVLAWLAAPWSSNTQAK
jgi:sterol desaturase/sphingolipid hydroxylase (fatty acid hydroxylase superfamily)